LLEEEEVVVVVVVRVREVEVGFCCCFGVSSREEGIEAIAASFTEEIPESRREEEGGRFAERRCEKERVSE
jgi:hypothetical protein